MDMKIDGDLAEIIGIHIGDGCISKNSRYSEYYLGGDLKEEKDYHNRWVSKLFNKKVMIPLYNKKIKYKEHPKVGIYGFHIFDEKIVRFFGDLGIHPGSKFNIGVPIEIRKNRMLTLRFLRGLFDTDGTIYFEKNRISKYPLNKVPNIKLGSVSKNLTKQVYKMLINLDMHPRLKKPYKGKRDKNIVYNVLIYRKGDINFFIKKIGFKNPKHYTKWQVFKKLGYCPPKTSLYQRREIISNKKVY